MTLGSPLAVTKIKQMITPIGHPACVKKWFNAMDERDIVALYPLSKKYFQVTPQIEKTRPMYKTRPRIGTVSPDIWATLKWLAGSTPH